MTAATDTPIKRTGRRAGYVIAIVINIFLLFVVNNLTSWDVASFLTDDFSEVVPFINLSLLASVGANALYLFVDTPVVKSASQVVVNAVGVVASVALFRVFPFDFADYSFDWAVLIRILLVIAIVGQGIAIVANIARLATAARH
jgi:hypothetical protein